MIPEYGGNVRRTSQAATNALLDEGADIEATDPAAPTSPPTPPDPSAGAVPWYPEPATGDPGLAPPPPLPPEAIPLPVSETLDSEFVPPPAPPERSRREGGRGRLDVVPPILLAALGLVAAVIAWRVGVASNIADDANRAGIDATRQRALTIIADEGITARSMEAFLDFSRDEQRAEALSAAGVNDQAQANRMAAAAHFGFVDSQYVDRNGQFQANQERAALLAGAEQNTDIQPLVHFETADWAYSHLNGLILAGIVVALALPFLTLAEIGRGRLRGLGILVGTGIFGTGIVLAALAWI